MATQQRGSAATRPTDTARLLDVDVRPVGVSTVSTGTILVDATKASTQVITLGADATVSFSGTPAAGVFIARFIVKQDGTGGRKIAWPSTVLWPGGVAPTLSTAPGAIDRIELLWDGQEVLGYMIGAAFAAPVVPTTQTLYVDVFTGTNGAAPAAAWTRVPTTATDRYPTGGTITIQSNAMRLSTNSTVAWTAGASIFLGSSDAPQGTSTFPAIVKDADYTFDIALLNLTQQYTPIGIRTRGPDLWPTGDAGNLFKSGYNIVLAPLEKTIDVVQGYNGASVLATPIPYTFPQAALKMRVLVKGKRLAFKLWAATGTEPGGVGSDASWTYTNTTALADESDGSIGFAAAQGPAAEAKTVTIDNFSSTTPILSLGTAQPAPTTAYSGFTPLFVENFDTAAQPGTAAGQFMSVYANSFQPYDDGGTIGAGAMYPRQMISAHDGVMDVSMDGQRASAGTFGAPSYAFTRIGGRFMMRAKCIGGFNNGPAFMIWPSSEVWAEGELDFPESVSGRGGTQGFQDSPWIHHHSMTPGSEANAQDVALGVSWRDWHVYTAEWFPPGKGPNPTTGTVIYYVDEVEVYRTVTDVPKTNHRWCFQIGDWGAPGHLYIDWLRMDAVA